MKLGYRIEVTPDDNGTLLVACSKLAIVATFDGTMEVDIEIREAA